MLESIAPELRAHIVGRRVRIDGKYPAIAGRTGTLVGYSTTIGPYDVYMVLLDGALYPFAMYLCHCELLKDRLH